MPFGNTYSDGTMRWNNKVISTAIQLSLIPDNVLNVGVGCNIKTDIINLSFKIVDIDGLTIIAHFMNEEVSGWILQATRIILYSSDKITYYLDFNSEEEAIIGDLRLYKTMEGFSVVDCGDENFI